MAPRHGLPHIGAPPTSLRPIARARVLGIERKRGGAQNMEAPKMDGGVWGGPQVGGEGTI